MSASLLGLLNWELQRDMDGHRSYTAEWKIQTSDTADGPATVMACPGLPAVGSYWGQTADFGNDVDMWALCWPDWKIRPMVTEEKNSLWLATQTFTTKPLKRCQDTNVDNPLSEPPDIGGSFIKKTKQALTDRFGNPIKNSSHEIIKGAAVERDDNRPAVNVAMNLLFLPLSTYAPMVDTVNAAPLWGLAAKMWKLGDIAWQRKLYGTCSYYYTVRYTFEANYQTWTRRIPDRGRKVLSPGGNPANPSDFEVYKDPRTGELAEVFLDGSGGLLPDGSPPFTLSRELYDETDFLALGIPSSL